MLYNSYSCIKNSGFLFIIPLILADNIINSFTSSMYFILFIKSLVLFN